MKERNHEMSQQEIKQFKVTLDGTEDERTYSFKRANYKVVMALDMEYRKAFSASVRAGIMTTAEAAKQMQESGAWTDKENQDVAEQMVEISTMEDDLRTRQKDPEADRKEMDELAKTLVRTRHEVYSKINEKSNLFENTAEGVADQHRTYKFIYFCLVDEKGTAVFDNEEELEEFTEKYPEAISFIYRNAYFHHYGLDENISATWAETEYYKQREEEIKEDLQKEEVKEEKPKPKVKRKKAKKKATTKTE